MADEEAQTVPDATVTVDLEQAPAPTRKKAQRIKKTATEKVTAAIPGSAKLKTRGLSSEEKLERVSQVDARVADGATLKDAVKIAGISDQTYYQWKKAIAQPAGDVRVPALPADDEFAEFEKLEEENRRLRKLLSEKLRAENAELRKKLGLK